MAKAISLDSKNNRITLDNGQSVDYTDLVIATGTSSPFPGKLGRDDPTYNKKEVVEKYFAFRKEASIYNSVILDYVQ